MLSIDLGRTTERPLQIHGTLITTALFIKKNGDKIITFNPKAVRDPNFKDNQVFSLDPYGKNFTSYPTSKINHKIVDKIIFICRTFE